MLPSFAYYIMNLRRNFVDFCNDKLQELELSQGQLLFIIYIGKHENCSPMELTDSLHLDRGHVTRSITKLVDSGYILKTVNEKDKRAHNLQLTEKGKHAVQISYELFNQWDQEVLRDFTESQRSQIIGLLKMINYRDEE